MEEILNKLYSYEYFGIYLMISIIVLIALFIIILFFGKKDQKEREIEATKKLQQINEDAFKDDSIEEKLEINNLNQDKLENDTIIMPSINDIPSINEISDNEIPEPVLPIQEDVVQVESAKVMDPEPVIDIPIVENHVIETPVIEPPVEEVTPLLEKVEEKPLVFADFDFSYDEQKKPEDIKIETVSQVIEPVVEREEVEVPEFNFDEIVKSIEEPNKEKTYTKGPEIFSSVYVAEKGEAKVSETTTSMKEELGIELPSLKKEVVEEKKSEEAKDEKIEMPILTDYNLDELSGETYTIK